MSFWNLSRCIVPGKLSRNSFPFHFWVIFRFHLNFLGIPYYNSLDGIPISRSIWGYDLLILVSEIPTVPKRQCCSCGELRDPNDPISISSFGYRKFWWDGINRYVLGSVVLNNLVVSLRPFGPHDSSTMHRKFHSLWYVGFFGSSILGGDSQRTCPSPNPIVLYVFVIFLWRTAENNDMRLDKATFRKVEFAMRFVQDGHVMNEIEILRKGNSDFSAVTSNACHTLFSYWLFYFGFL